MIRIYLNQRDFEYDIYSLVKAFFPKEDVQVLAEPEQEDISSGGDKESEAEKPLEVSVFYAPAADAPEEGCSVEVSFCGGGKTVTGREIIPDLSDRLKAKSIVKKLLYPMLTQFTGQELPWGDLTGIRPARLVMNLLRQGESNREAARFLREEYFVSPKKAALAVHIANREKAILDGLDAENGYSLYIGIPFCPSICLYCSFSSSPLALWKDHTDAYLDALEKEIRESAHTFAGKTLQTVYIGGGTPTTLSPGQLDRLLGVVEDTFDLSRLLEYTVEAGRPDSITAEKLAVLRDHNVSRISINPQTMNQATLDLIGRKHTVQQVKESFYLARELGFDNINTDLIVGLPSEGCDEVAHTMDEIASLGPESVTVHALALKRAARLNLFRKEWQDISFHASDEIMDLTLRRCEERGLYPYYMYRQKNIAGNFENVGYSLAGKECLYNILIMEEVQSILAVGAGASTKIVYGGGRIERVENVKDIRQYIDRIDEMIIRKKKLSDQQKPI